jgi:hypothetical protein
MELVTTELPVNAAELKIHCDLEVPEWPAFGNTWYEIEA